VASWAVRCVYLVPVALSVRSADEPTLRLFDAALVAWMTLWLVIGVATGVTLWQAADVGDTLGRAGTAIGSAGTALTDLADIPLVGERPAELGAEASATGADITARGPEVKAELRRLAVLLTIAIALIPTTPVLGLYVPLRLARRREVRDLRRSVQATARGSARDPDLDAYLAHRAVRALPYADVRRVLDAAGPTDPRSRDQLLADAELARLGIRRPRG